MRKYSGMVLTFAGSVLLLSMGQGQKRPADVPANHWAAGAVQRVVQSGLLPLSKDQFQGDTKVTRTQAVIAVANLARALDTQQWKAEAGKPVPASVEKTLTKGAWKTQGVSRYAFAVTLARMGDYVAKGMRRAAPGRKDTGKSEILERPKVVVPATHAAYKALTYLAQNRMIGAKSPLMRPDNKPVSAAEVSFTLAEMVTGLSDKVIDLGHEEDGTTPDKTFHKKP